jgi:hypothetical protein
MPLRRSVGNRGSAAPSPKLVWRRQWKISRYLGSTGRNLGQFFWRHPREIIKDYENLVRPDLLSDFPISALSRAQRRIACGLHMIQAEGPSKVSIT